MTPSAYHIVDESVLRLMQPHAVFVNCARGGLVDTDALTRALQEKWIAAAAIDVAEPEPLPNGHPLFGLDNSTITTPSAGSEPSVREPLATVAAEGAVQALRGERPWRLVNPDVWPRLVERQTAAGV
jgi:phosphoglycerate dehydrogenase-like enzyme